MMKREAIRADYMRRRRENPNMTAIAAYSSARRSYYFRQDLVSTIRADKRRTKAANKGWQTRRANGN